RAENVPMSGSMLMCKAKWYCEKLGITDSNCSLGFLDRWKTRHCVSDKSVTGEKASADFLSAEKFLPIFSKETEGLLPCQIFNADETGLYWLLMPTNSLVHEKETQIPGHKTAKQRVTILGCSNASGKFS
ncbi:unnamed protein product, partial [Meganyctiphanes norvegica]